MNTTKPCRYCKGDILKDASVCKHCGKKQSDGFFKIVSKVILTLLTIGIISTMLSPGSKTSTSAQKEKVEISEAQCKIILDQLYSSVVTNEKQVKETDLEYKVTKSILEQKLAEAGFPVASFTSPNTEYVIPQSKCGNTLSGLFDVIVTGEKNARK